MSLPGGRYDHQRELHCKGGTMTNRDRHCGKEARRRSNPLNKQKLMNKLLVLVALCCITSQIQAQTLPWKKGIVTEEFIFEKAPFPESHAATIAETPKGLIASWFGGTKERNPDVEIWVSRQ